MKIFGLNKIRRTANALIGASAMLCAPVAAKSGAMKTATRNCPAIVRMPGGSELPLDSLKLSYKKGQELAKKLPRTFYFTKSEGMTEFFDDEGLKLLRNLFLTDSSTPKAYSRPISAEYSPYISKNGLFGAKKGLLPNLGVEITVNKSDVQSIPAVSPITGIIISQKTPPRGTGIRETKIMGIDGKIYVFKFNSAAKDYISSKLPVFRKIGTLVNQNDTVGLIRNTPNTDKFSLHFRVEDLDVKSLQEKNDAWIGLKDFFGVEIAGQVNPLDPKKAGKIASVLRQYRIENGEALPLIKSL